MNKKNLLLGGVLIVLIAISYLYQGPLKKWQKQVGQKSNFFKSINIDKASKIEIVRQGKKMTLELKDGKWVDADMKNFPVKEEYSKGLIDALKKAGDGELALVSNNKDKKSEYETGDKGISVKIESDGQSLEMVIGKLAPDFVSAYVSKKDANETYTTSAGLRTYLDSGEWHDTTIFSSDKSKISKIRFQYPGRQFTIEKKGDKWVKANQEKMDKIAELMSTMTAVSIPEQTFKGTGLEKNSIIVEATGDGVKNTIMVGDAQKTSGNYFAKRGDSDRIYLISKADRDALNKKIEELK